MQFEIIGLGLEAVSETSTSTETPSESPTGTPAITGELNFTAIDIAILAAVIVLAFQIGKFVVWLGRRIVKRRQGGVSDE